MNGIKSGIVALAISSVFLQGCSVTFNTHVYLKEPQRKEGVKEQKPENKVNENKKGGDIEARVYQKQQQSPEQVLIKSSGQEATILDANLWLMPEPLSTDNDSRLEKFIEYAQKTRPDVITLQEVWLNKDADRIKHGLPNYFLYSSNSSGIFNKSGLLTLTLKRSYSSEFRKFPEPETSLAYEKFAEKGYLMTTIPTELGNIPIINTHLYSAKGLDDKKVTHSQFRILKNLYIQHMVVVGDTNIPENEYQILNNGRFFSDKNENPTCAPENKYSRKGVNSINSRQKGEKIDRLMISKSLENYLTIESAVIYDEFSDHYAIGYKLAKRHNYKSALALLKR